MEADEDGKVLVSESNVGRLYVYWEEYRSNLFLHIRYWIFDKKTQQCWIPGKKGIAIPFVRVQTMLQALAKVMKQVDDKGNRVEAEPKVTSIYG